jgi:hypothetical protein
MIRSGFGGRRSSGVEPPIELRFVDLFMILLTAFIFMTALLSIFSAAGSVGEQVYPPRVLTETLPDALAGQPYQVMLAASGGSGGYTWRVTGELPTGLRLNDAGALAGTPETVQRSKFQVVVTDERGRSASGPVELSVLPAIAKQTPDESPIHLVAEIALPDATATLPYEATLKAIGGIGPYIWKAEGELPKGLTISTGGAVRGTLEDPSTLRPHTFGVTVTDAGGRSAAQQMRLWVAAAPQRWWSRALSWLLPLAWIWFLWKGGPGLQAIWDEMRARRRRRQFEY